MSKKHLFRQLSCLFLLSLLTSFGTAARAETPTDADIDRLFVVMRMQATVEVTLPALLSARLEMEMELATGAGAGDTQRQQCVRDLQRGPHPGPTWQDVEPHLREYYRQRYTRFEIHALIEFYQTPAGRKSLDVLPVTIEAMLSASVENGQQAASDNDIGRVATPNRSRTGANGESVSLRQLGNTFKGTVRTTLSATGEVVDALADGMVEAIKNPPPPSRSSPSRGYDDDDDD